MQQAVSNWFTPRSDHWLFPVEEEENTAPVCGLRADEEKLLFAVSDVSEASTGQCDASFPHGTTRTPLDPDHSPQFLDTNAGNIVHNKWLQVLRGNEGTVIKITWEFLSGPKSLRERFTGAEDKNYDYSINEATSAPTPVPLVDSDSDSDSDRSVTGHK